MIKWRIKYRRYLLLTIAFALSALMFWLRDNSVATAAFSVAAGLFGTIFIYINVRGPVDNLLNEVSDIEEKKKLTNYFKVFESVGLFVGTLCGMIMSNPMTDDKFIFIGLYALCSTLGISISLYIARLLIFFKRK